MTKKNIFSAKIMYNVINILSVNKCTLDKRLKNSKN